MLFLNDVTNLPSLKFLQMLDYIGLFPFENYKFNSKLRPYSYLQVHNEFIHFMSYPLRKGTYL